jgi:putative membrane protein
MKIIWHWVLLAAALYSTAYIFPGKIGFHPMYSVFVVAAVLMFINATVRPVIRLLTLPITILTLGIFSLVLNGAIFWFLSSIVKGFTVTNFTAAVLGALMVSIINWILTRLFRSDYVQ